MLGLIINHEIYPAMMIRDHQENKSTEECGEGEPTGCARASVNSTTARIWALAENIDFGKRQKDDRKI